MLILTSLQHLWRIWLGQSRGRVRFRTAFPVVGIQRFDASREHPVQIVDRFCQPLVLARPILLVFRISLVKIDGDSTVSPVRKLFPLQRKSEFFLNVVLLLAKQVEKGLCMPSAEVEFHADALLWPYMAKRETLMPLAVAGLIFFGVVILGILIHWPG